MRPEILRSERELCVEKIPNQSLCEITLIETHNTQPQPPQKHTGRRCILRRRIQDWKISPSLLVLTLPPFDLMLIHLCNLGAVRNG